MTPILTTVGCAFCTDGTARDGTPCPDCGGRGWLPFEEFADEDAIPSCSTCLAPPDGEPCGCVLESGEDFEEPRAASGGPAPVDTGMAAAGVAGEGPAAAEFSGVEG